MESERDGYFAELPAALVQEVLNRTQEVSAALTAEFAGSAAERDERRAELEDAGLLRRDAELDYAPIPTTCGVDGAFVVERLLATDLVVVAAVAMEGFTPPKEPRFWPEPRHEVYVDTESHHAQTGTLARALMLGMEYDLAVQAPHDVVFFDGSFATPLIHWNQALNAIGQADHLKVAQQLSSAAPPFLKNYRQVLQASRTDKSFVAVPKYTARKEVAKAMRWSTSADDRALLTHVLRAGEYTKPLPLEPPERPWHLNVRAMAGGDSQKFKELEKLESEITNVLDGVQVLYYRPFPYLPALRLEVSHAVATAPARLGGVFQALRHQCGVPALMEPYPLHMADRMAKSLAPAVPAFRQIISQVMAESYQGDVNDIFLSFHSYRTESGRG